MTSDIGHESHVIDYRTALHTRNRRIFRPSNRGLARTIPKYAVLLARYSRLKRRRQRFDQFIREYLNLSDKQYTSYADLVDNLPPYDAFVCGSDQIWSPYSTLDPAYFLCFANGSEIRRIAYAPSFGVSALPEELREMLRERISNIPHLSVREHQGRSIIKELTGRDAEVVLDPTLLLSATDWTAMTKSAQIKSPYILVYAFQNKPILSALVRDIRERIGLPLPTVAVTTGPANGLRGVDTAIFDAGPQEFLGLLSQAACVCTDSFHGTGFSILFRKPFFTVLPPLVGSRLSSLLERLELTSQLMTGTKDVPADPLKLDFCRAEQLLDQEREKSLRFLRASLGMEWAA
ncbi:MAG: hypothetical protein CEE38_23225 [Planctomycetes bacterium B3_Pla]|nr:MAG: hypothetical protein CEE38_23225 [Planctomycetes bacterium B3_Pla]